MSHAAPRRPEVKEPPAPLPGWVIQTLQGFAALSLMFAACTAIVFLSPCP